MIGVLLSDKIFIKYWKPLNSKPQFDKDNSFKFGKFWREFVNILIPESNILLLLKFNEKILQEETRLNPLDKPAYWISLVAKFNFFKFLVQSKPLQIWINPSSFILFPAKFNVSIYQFKLKYYIR